MSAPKTAEVRREDQIEINEFGKLNGKKKDLKLELEETEVCNEERTDG